MYLVSKLRWALIATSLVSGSALAANINCELTPGNSVITDGQTLQLAANCDGQLSDIALSMRVNTGTTWTTWKNVSGTLSLSSYNATKNSISFTSPINSVALGGNEIEFDVDGTPVTTPGSVTSNTAKVVIKPVASSAAVATTGFASTSIPVDAACAALPATVSTLPTGTTACQTGSSQTLVVTGPTYYSWSCISLTGGAEANCYATRDVTYTVSASAGSGGTISPSGSSAVSAGATKAFTVTPSTSSYSIASVTGCNGSLSGSTYTTGAISGNCTVSASFVLGTPTSYTVTATAGSGGSISPAGSVTVTAGATKAFTVTPSGSNSINTVTGCGGSLSGTTYTTGPINSACSVSATFSAPPPPPTGDDPGSGLWVPSGTTNRIVADPSGPIEGPRIQSYVPGCLNGGSANFSSGGCAALSSYTGTLTGTSTPQTVSFGSGKQVVLRYQPVAGAGSSVKSLKVRGSTGGNVVVNMRVWLSTDPTATYESVPEACKQTSTTTPKIYTGTGYCPISASTPVYYLGIAFDEPATSSTSRFIVDESYSDLY
jgi:hypothetical protein